MEIWKKYISSRLLQLSEQRDADDYAVSAAERISAELSAKGITIISGFARGIDSAAHGAALDSGGQTIAVFRLRN